MNMTSAAKNTAAALACPYSECPLDILCSEQCAAEKPSMTNPRDDGAPIKSERQEAMAARAEVEDVVRCLREACAYINITEQVRGYHSAASNGLVVDAADLIDRLSRQLAEARAEKIALQNALAECGAIPMEIKDEL